ncbi:MAG: threonine synthase [Firmicutes bacterium]|nr:threonine synthase [Bacillota bacterium]
MKYVSTRGGGGPVTAAEAIRLGIAPDGGLFTPQVIPNYSEAGLSQLISLSYQELATEIISSYLTDYQKSDIRKMTAAAYRSPLKFDHPQVTPVIHLSGAQYILELWHGPTCAFKDVALQLLPYLMPGAAEAGPPAKDKTEIVILVATSGDTGKAALEGFRDVPGTKIIVFFPDQGVSQIQRLQMVTQEGQNTAVVSVRGNFDDAQNGVKQLFTDPELIQKLKLNGQAFSSANSINWGRLVPQIAYYFFGYFELCRQQAIRPGAPINVTVPTGNFGNILAAYLAKQMGLPIAKLICASNANNVLADFINTGVYDRHRNFYTTISPSMDILISSNLERLLYYLSGQNAPQITAWMRQLKADGRYEIDAAMKQRLKDIFYGGYASEAETMKTIRQTFESTGQALDPHTAVGVTVYQKYRQDTGDQTPALFAATASPFKFNSSVIEAIAGKEAVSGLDEFQLLERLHQLTGMPIPPSLAGLKEKPIRHHTVCAKEEMKAVVEKILKLK